MNETERQKIAERARKAAEILSSDVMKDAFDGLEKANIEVLLSLGPDKDAERRDKVNQINAIRALRGQLKSYVSEGGVIAKVKPGIV